MRLPWLALLLPLTLIAGCFGGDDSGGEPTVTPSPTPTPGPTVVRTLEVQDRREVTGVATGIDEFIDVGFEPSVEVAADGTIYVTAARGAGSHGSLLWVSRDNGTTFVHIPFADPATGVSNLPFGAEGDLAVDAASRAYFVDLTLASTTVSRSTDQGRTWEVRNPAAFVVPGGDREWVAAGPEELVAVTWNHLAGESSAPGMWVAVSADGGRTFPTQTVVLDAGGGFAGGIGMGPDGTLVVARIPDDVTAHVSNDRGATFTRSVVHATQGNATYLVAFADVDAAGNLYVAWTEQAGNASQAFYAVSTDQGATWRRPVQASHHVGSTMMTHVDAAEAGHIAIAYYCAPGEEAVPDDVTGDWHVCATDIHGADTDSPVLDIVQLTEEPVKTGPICTGGLQGCGATGSENRELGDYLQGAIGPDGRVHVAWCDANLHVFWGVAGVTGSA